MIITITVTVTAMTATITRIKLETNPSPYPPPRPRPRQMRILVQWNRKTNTDVRREREREARSVPHKILFTAAIKTPDDHRERGGEGGGRWIVGGGLTPSTVRTRCLRFRVSTSLPVPPTRSGPTASRSCSRRTCPPVSCRALFGRRRCCSSCSSTLKHEGTSRCNWACFRG